MIAAVAIITIQTINRTIINIKDILVMEMVMIKKITKAMTVAMVTTVTTETTASIMP